MNRRGTGSGRFKAAGPARGSSARLPAAFILIAMVNFAAGATLGGLMANRPAWWAALGGWHGELNRFGWLTMMIYGMTYAVLSISAGLRLPWPWLGFVHLVVAEAGVVAVGFGGTTGSSGWTLSGLVLQALAPTLFMFNILTAVVYTRRARHREEEAAPSTHPAIVWLARSPAYRATDRIAQRGTDVALLLLLAGVWWQAVASLAAGRPVPVPGATTLVEEGWIAGTVLAVALHLAPRFWPWARWPRPWLHALQAVWLIGVTAAAWGPDGWAGAGVRAIGLALAGWAVMHLAAVSPGVSRQSRAEGNTGNGTGTGNAAECDSGRNRHRGGDVRAGRVPAHARWLWRFGWAMALALGIVFLAGMKADALAARHLLFLGWTSSLVYSVGYTLFPALLGRGVKGAAFVRAQVICACAGAALLSAGFLIAPWVHGEAAAFWMVPVAAGGTLAWLGAAMFLFDWL
ncbi:hypothetical protein GCM10010885_15250 [Alicyclobacillus cellulosilyticus]|uniref:NnrS family protein n=1 Tax=Alicyclobacillus cellulosilyticus TaxID=1003997 RepID=A0A917NLM5_9BACL|nr:hypothetical protein [Alicyclobacillus cellulosilyticus]GGJ07025.1 hypothetical protein GCM10010885_15250 [Alicyclobacillus cellulosilyticus]